MGKFVNTPGFKNVYLVERLPTVSRDDLVLYWICHHMPNIIAAKQADEGRILQGYEVSLIEQSVECVDSNGLQLDGIGALKADRKIIRKNEDSLHDRVKPFHAWYTTEYVITDLDEEQVAIDVVGQGLVPSIRDGVTKVSRIFVKSPDVNFTDMTQYWLEIRAPEIQQRLNDLGGLGYSISLSIEPPDPYAGLEEYYFPDADSWHRFVQQDTPESDGVFDSVHAFMTHTELVGF